MAEMKKTEDVVLSEEDKSFVGKKSKSDFAAKIAKEDEEYIDYFLDFDGNKDDDVPVGINGEMIYIKRGEKVRIKRKFVKVIEAHRAQDREAARNSAAMAGIKHLGDM